MDNSNLSFEKQFEKRLNNAEIERIKDNELRKIRWDFWLKRHEAFLDEAHIPDSKVFEVWEEIDEQERVALNDYCKRHNIAFRVEA